MNSLGPIGLVTPPPISLHIRRLGPGDAGNYRAIRLAALLHAREAVFGASYEDEAAMAIEAFERRLEDLIALGSFLGERLIGTAALSRSAGSKERHKGTLIGMFVDPACRRCGAGRALVEAILDHAAALVEQVTLTVVTTNVAAIALYKSTGFERYGVEPRALKEQTQYFDEAMMIYFCGTRALP